MLHALHEVFIKYQFNIVLDISIYDNMRVIRDVFRAL